MHAAQQVRVQAFCLFGGKVMLQEDIETSNCSGGQRRLAKTSAPVLAWYNQGHCILEAFMV